jgi:hypothetical protein
MTKFLDLLQGNEYIDCDLIIGDSDMPASFVWDEDTSMTDYGIEYFKPILDAEYERLPNGNIEIFCDDWELGEDFCYAVAGYVSEEKYRKLFNTPE